MIRPRLLIIGIFACSSMQATVVTGIGNVAVNVFQGSLDLFGDDFEIKAGLDFAGQGAYCPVCVPGSTIGPSGGTNGSDVALSVLVNGMPLVLDPSYTLAGFFFSGPTTDVLPGVFTYSLPFTFSGSILSYPGPGIQPCVFCEPDLTGSGTAVIHINNSGLQPFVDEETYFFAPVPEPDTLAMAALALVLAAAVRIKRAARKGTRSISQNQFNASRARGRQGATASSIPYSRVRLRRRNIQAASSTKISA